VKRQSVWLALLVAVVTALLLSGCASNAPRFVDERKSYSADAALELPLDINAGAVAGRPVSEADKLRTDALADLRRQGGDKADVAAIITKSLPNNSHGVPFYIELAEVDNVPAIIVIEAIGPKKGTLEDKRVWVLDRKGSILLMGNR